MSETPEFAVNDPSEDSIIELPSEMHNRRVAKKSRRAPGSKNYKMQKPLLQVLPLAGSAGWLISDFENELDTRGISYGKESVRNGLEALRLKKNSVVDFSGPPDARRYFLKGQPPKIDIKATRIDDSNTVDPKAVLTDPSVSELEQKQFIDYCWYLCDVLLWVLVKIIWVYDNFETFGPSHDPKYGRRKELLVDFKVNLEKCFPFLEYIAAGRRISWSLDDSCSKYDENDISHARGVCKSLFISFCEWLPIISTDMQLLLHSKWRTNCNGKLATEIFLGRFNETEGIGDGSLECKRLHFILKAFYYGTIKVDSIVAHEILVTPSAFTTRPVAPRLYFHGTLFGPFGSAEGWEPPSEVGDLNNAENHTQQKKASKLRRFLGIVQ